MHASFPFAASLGHVIIDEELEQHKTILPLTVIYAKVFLLNDC